MNFGIHIPKSTKNHWTTNLERSSSLGLACLWNIPIQVVILVYSGLVASILIVYSAPACSDMGFTRSLQIHEEKRATVLQNAYAAGTNDGYRV